MQTAPLPHDEGERLAALQRYGILDTPAECEFDDLALLAAQVCGTPIALVSLIDFDRQWFKAKFGLNIAQTPRDIAFCAHAICGTVVMVVPDALADDRFADNPLVTAEPHIRFYAGAPLRTPEGHALGTLCVMDRFPRELTDVQQRALHALGSQASRLLDLRLARRELEYRLTEEADKREALRAAEEFTTRMVECSRDCIKVLDLDARLLAINAGGMEVLEICDFAPLRHTSWLDFWKGEHRLAAEAAVVAARAGGVGRFVGYCPTMGGKPRWWDVVVNAIRDAAGRVELLLAVSRDATERKQAEESLQAMYRFNQEIVDGASEGIVVYDQELRYLRWNRFMEDLTGMPAAEVLGRVAPDVFPFLREQGIDAFLRRALEGETVLLADILVRMPRTGREVWESNRYAPHRDAQGNIVGVIGMIRDVTERRRAEEQLRAVVEGTATATGEEFFRSLVRHLAAALQVRHAFVTECNRPERTRVRTLAFWMGDRYAENVDYEVATTPCAKVLEGEICCYANGVQALFPDDLDLAALEAESYLGIALNNAAGEIVGHIAVLDDRPMQQPPPGIELLRVFAARAGAELERMKAEESLRQALAEVEDLKNRVQEENVYLRRELIANVSHDLRSPLASLQGYLEMLRLKDETMEPEQRRAYLEIASRQSQHLGTLVAELFELAKLDFKGYQINPEPVHLGELAQDVLQKFQLAADKKGVGLHADIHPEVGFVRADMGLIERALENLLENALKHTHVGGTVRLAVAPHDGKVVLRLSDTGCGIPEPALAHIFERFYRADAALAMDSGGAGLGLAIVKRILELHHTAINVESELTAGTTFSFALPLAQSPLSTTTKAPIRASS